jgi:hypothetical protein
MPEDVARLLVYREDKDWLYFIESVTSVGPMDNKRIVELQELTKNVKSGKIFVTAFLDFKTFKKFLESLAWDTEVWMVDMPDHLIHLNGDRFLGPR